LKFETPRNRDAHLASAAERLGAIVEAAERAAESVIDDAEAEARDYLARAHAEADRAFSERGAELSRLVDSLLADAIAMHEGAERMVDSLRRAQQGLRPAAGEPAEEPAAPRLASVERLRPREPLAAPPAPEPEPGPSSPTAGARLLATQLAVSGSSREEIDRRLRSGFELEDTSAILDAILGPEE
jgi:vacuolar-type H+-ATPase subunit H